MFTCCGLLESHEPSGSGFSADLAIKWGYTLTTGGRQYMEDYHSAESRDAPDGTPVGVFAVYDGHGGRKCVQFVRAKLIPLILNHASFLTGDVEAAMREAFVSVDKQFAARHTRSTCGTTASIVLVQGRKLHVAHVGDSRAVLVTPTAARSLTKDHKPDDDGEAARIEGDHDEKRVQAKGGSITNDDVARVEGVLAVTRAFGNNAMKSIIDAEPDVSSHSISADDLAVVIASDGVWDVLSNDDAAAIVRRTVRSQAAAASECEVAADRITTEAYRLGSMDNISAVVLQLNCTGPWTAGQRAQMAVKQLSQRGQRPKPALGEGDPHGVTVCMDAQAGDVQSQHGITLDMPKTNGVA